MDMLDEENDLHQNFSEASLPSPCLDKDHKAGLRASKNLKIADFLI